MEATLSTLLSPVIDKLVVLLHEEAKSLTNISREIGVLREELDIIQSYLRDADARSSSRGGGDANGTTKTWLRHVREEAERIEDAIDEFKSLATEPRDKPGLAGFKALRRRCGLASAVRQSHRSLRNIKDRAERYGLAQGPRAEAMVASGTAMSARQAYDPRMSSLFVERDELVGVESIAEELVGRLIGGGPRRSVITLVGEGGIGKTTLAKSVYEDEAAKGQFDCRAWITVSQSHGGDEERLLKSLKAEVLPREELDATTSGEFRDIELVRNHLMAKRYLIVFDDVWKSDYWELIKLALPSNDKGSRIIVTTRHTAIANSFKEASCDVVYGLKPWSLEQSLKLFCRKAFSSEHEGRCPSELKQFSCEIVSKCQGLPLVIVAVAGLLSKKEKTESEWKRVLENLDYEFCENRELTNVSKILLLSYHDLPYHLKLCFLYFGVFPRDSSIFLKRLCKLWIAEGFVEPRAGKTLEQVAEEYLNELVDRNLVSTELRYGIKSWCRVHDLIRETILTQIKDSCFCQIFGENRFGRLRGKTRRLSIHGAANIREIWETIGDSNIRSVFLFDVDELTSSFLIDLFRRFKLLNVLDLEDTPLNTLPKEVGTLFCLKYLGLRNTKLKKLPKSVGKLRSLHTLDLSRTLVRKLPAEINKLSNLQHLFAYSFDDNVEYGLNAYSGVGMLEGIGRLASLQTLTCMEAHSGQSRLADELRSLKNLTFLSVSKVTAELAKGLAESIQAMKHLQALYLSASDEDEALDLEFAGPAPPFLRFLQLNCRLRRFPSWISGGLHDLQGLELNFSRLVYAPLSSLQSLPNLEYLRMFEAFEGEELFFGEGGFPKLKELRLRKLEGLKAVRIERGALPHLEELYIGPSPEMREVPAGIEHLASLKSLGTTDMPREFVASVQPEGGADYGKIRHIASVVFWYYKRRGFDFEGYKLGSAELLQRLRERPVC